MSRKLLILILPLLLTAKAFAQENTTWLNPVDGAEFVKIPAGEFSAIIRNSEGKDSTIIAHFASDFYVATTEVTVLQFSKFVEQTGYITDAERDDNKFTWKQPGFPQDETHPVVFVSYKDALAYADWAQVDLPTEAEWLYTCRAGTQTAFYWGDSLRDEFLWNRRNTNGTGTRAVGSKPANPWGLFNMVGNVREYVNICSAYQTVRGSSWTRCPSYKTRQGYVADNLIAASVEPRLTECVKPQYPLSPYDDDRGFRCVKRMQ